MRFSKKSKKISELVDKDNNIISGESGNLNQDEVESNSTTDMVVSTTRQPVGSEWYSNPQYVTEIANDVIKDIKETLINREEVAEIPALPSIDELKSDYPLIVKNTRILIDSINKVELDTLAKVTIVGEILSLIDFKTAPQNIKDLLIKIIEGGRVKTI